MRLEIRDSKNKLRGTWVAKTTRGFNKTQREEIANLRRELSGKGVYTERHNPPEMINGYAVVGLNP